MKATQLREKSIEELNTELSELRKQQFNLRMQQAEGAIQPGSLIKNIRRNIARIKTVLNERTKEVAA